MKARLDNYVIDDNGCWVWQGAINTSGYGTAGGKLAHRLSYEVHVAPIPEGLLVLHRCDTPPCVNPAHLFVGTQRDNVRDMVAKGRARITRDIGEAHPRSRCTEEQVLRIRELLSAGSHAVAEVAELTGTTVNIVKDVARGKTWRHLGDVTWERPPRVRRSHCPHGHLYDEQNTRIRRDGTRSCRACARDRRSAA